MTTIRIKDIVQSGQFTICGRHRIIQFLGIENCGETVPMWDSKSGEAIPTDLMDYEVTAMNVTDDGYLEIEYDGAEYIGPAF